MTARGYTSKQAIEEHLGITLSTSQSAEADRLIEEIEQWIDQQTGRAWLTDSPLTEAIIAYGPTIRVANPPVLAITRITAESGVLLSVPIMLPATSYRLMDAALGLVAVPGYQGHLLHVTYTHDDPGPPVPGPISLATRLIVAQQLQPALAGVGGGDLRAYSVGGELSVTYATGINGEPLAVPAMAMKLIMGHKRQHFA